MNGDPRAGGPQRPWGQQPPPPREPPPMLYRHPHRPPPPAHRPMPAAPRPVAQRHAPPPRPSAPPPPPPRPPVSRRRRSWPRRLAGLTLLLVLLGAAGLAGTAAWLDAVLQRAAVFSGYADRPAPGRGTTWLLVGTDSRADLTAQEQRDLSTGGDIGDGRTDTLLLIHLPAAGSGSPATVVSIPRDSYVPIPDYGDDKINAAFTLGGAPLLTRTVEQATGLRLDHYVEIGFGGFAALVDALGGVRLCPDEPLDDPLAGLNLPAGCQKLAGAAALGYVRSRATPRADLDRMDNQRLFLAALLTRIADPAVWLNPLRWYTVPHAAAHAVTVDAGAGVLDLAALGWALRGATTMLTVPIGEFTETDVGDAVVWDHPEAARLFDALSRDDPPTPGPDE
ncbi:LCP family protein [Mycolicibacter longobardus]|uniref:LytTR family transcriptional regulator n=1 Tax=Mycolicibacter longobardus TaxID=1108812 RepID=A0A1X1YHA9_9MYCO|nr:LCP family protein [Mycolicibacter longobardus]MCV7382324.1 LCP family protein [Mycolicibacter longobardus]ORW10468.1 LytTR family transcriptional regulator [Mycolicibacter longobardus]